MSKNNNKNHTRELLSAEEIPEIRPKNIASQEAKANPSELRDAVINASKSKKRGTANAEKVSWNDFLNAIDRDERIAFRFDQTEVKPLDEKLGEEPDTVDALLKVGDEVFGKIQLEGGDELSPENARMLSSVAEQVSQHIENLRLVEQANQYRAEAEDASRQLTQKGWEDYLRSADAPALSYIYDQKRVVAADNAETLINLTNAEVITRIISVRDEPIGRLSLADIAEKSVEAQNLLSTVIDGLSAHIENLRLLDETERSRQQLDKRAAELETVAKVSTAAAAIRDPESLLRSVVDLTNYSFKLYHTSVYLLGENEKNIKTLDLFAASGKTGHKMLKKGRVINFNEDKSLIAQAARTSEILIIEDTANNPLFQKYAILPDTRSQMAIPMIVANKLIGIFNVESETPNRFAEEDMQTYSTLASQTAVALQNAQLYEEQIETVERLRELDHLKSSFLANMSHELRTPLNSISGFTQVILEGLDGPLSKEMEEDLGLIDKNAGHLLRLINEVLDMAKIEAGNLMVTLGPSNLYQMLEEVIKTTSALAHKNNLLITLENNLPKDLIVIADDMRIQQVMINLIGNATKFTLEGSIKIHSEIDDDVIRIKVIDTGIGIPPDLLEAIFEAFSQVDTTTTRKVGGTGLGLPISKQFIEMHNGRLWAESTGISGEGSVFTIEIPVVLPEN